MGTEELNHPLHVIEHTFPILCLYLLFFHILTDTEGEHPKTMPRRLKLSLNDRVYYMADPSAPEYLKYGFVTEVKRRDGVYSYVVTYDDGSGVGHFRSDYDGDCLFKSTKPVEETKK